MAFNSLAFLVFFAAVVAVHHALPFRWRWIALLVASAWFYSAFQPFYLLLLAYAVLVAWLVGRALSAGHGRGWAAAGILAELAVLVIYKYADFITGSVGSGLAALGAPAAAVALPRLDLVLPVGLSFYTFSAISYIVDVKRGTILAEPHPGKLALYIAFFPKLIAGPIERAGSFLKQIAEPATFSPALAVAGLQLMLLGYFKKVVIADRLAEVVAQGFGNPALQSPVTVLLAVYLYAFQIYCDFSGYSDIAIGAAALLGIRLMENFRRPYFAASVPEFWSRRWHISLMAWFRDYLYIPLGGSRVSRPRHQANVMLVFLVSGLWHGAAWTFVIWGALNGLYQLLHLATERPRAALARVLPGPVWTLLGVFLTFHLVSFAWIFFRADGVAKAWVVVTRIAGALPQYPALIASYVWPAEVKIAAACIAALLIVEAWDEWRGFWRWLDARPLVLRWGFYYAVLGSLLVIGKWGASQFVYAQF